MTIDRKAVTRTGFLGAVAVAFMSPKKALGIKRDLPKFKHRDVLTHDQMNAIVERINER